MHKRPNTLVFGSHLFVGLLTDMFRRLPASVHPSPSQPFANDLLSQKKDVLHTYSTMQKKALHRVQVFHLIPLFSRTRLRVSPKGERSRNCHKNRSDIKFTLLTYSNLLKLSISFSLPPLQGSAPSKLPALQYTPILLAVLFFHRHLRIAKKGLESPAYTRRF